MKLEVSNWSLVWNYLTGGFGGVADYLLDILNNALKNLDASKKDNIQSVLNFALKILATINALSWLCPTKWQTALKSTVAAIDKLIEALSDLSVTQAELTAVYGKFVTAVECWKSPDDGTCMDSVED